MRKNVIKSLIAISALAATSAIAHNGSETAFFAELGHFLSAPDHFVPIVIGVAIVAAATKLLYVKRQ